jgi:hypothetical protein
MIGYYGDTPTQEEEGRQILTILWWAYPGHPWFVRVYNGGFFIRHLDFTSGWGMNVKLKDVFSASQMKREIIMKAGEWLDRAGIPRGRYDSDTPSYRVEGVPEKFQPKQPLPDNFTIEVKADEFTPLREQPRPQVLKNAAD